MRRAFNLAGVDIDVTPSPGEDERRAILAALEAAVRLPHAYTSAWRAWAVEPLGDDALAQQRGGDAGVVEP